MPTQSLHRDWFQAPGGLGFKGNSQGSYWWPEQGSNTAPPSLAQSLPYKEGEKQNALDGVPGPRQGLGVRGPRLEEALGGTYLTPAPLHETPGQFSTISCTS